MEKINLTKKVIDLGNKVLVLKANVETVRPIVEGYQMEIINTFGLKNKKTGKLITDLFHTYRMSAKDFKIFLKQCNLKAKENGFNVEINYCPLLIAENKQREAQREFLKEICKLPGINMDFNSLILSLKNYNKMLELSLNLIVTYQNI